MVPLNRFHPLATNYYRALILSFVLIGDFNYQMHLWEGCKEESNVHWYIGMSNIIGCLYGSPD